MAYGENQAKKKHSPTKLFKNALDLSLYGISYHQFLP